MIDLEMTGERAVAARLGALHRNVRERLSAVLGVEATRLRDAVKARIASLFKSGSGRLADSISGEVEDQADEVGIRVFSQGLPYARIQEFGGIVQHPGSSKLQVFMGKDGKMVFTRGTAPHPIPIPERSYLRSTLAERRLEILGAIRGAVQNGMEA